MQYRKTTAHVAQHFGVNEKINHSRLHTKIETRGAVAYLQRSGVRVKRRYVRIGIFSLLTYILIVLPLQMTRHGTYLTVIDMAVRRRLKPVKLRCRFYMCILLK